MQSTEPERLSNKENSREEGCMDLPGWGGLGTGGNGNRRDQMGERGM